MPISVEQSDMPYVFDIQVRVEAGEDWAFCQIAGYHTNVILLSKNGIVMEERPYEEQTAAYKTDRSLLSIDGIVDDATETEIYDLQGRRVSYMTKGVYIVNGKKVVR
jgi:L-cysteine desulfidase